MSEKSMNDMKVSAIEMFPIRVPFLRAHKIALGSAEGRGDPRRQDNDE